MGNHNCADLDTYYMHIQFIGSNMQNLLKSLSGSNKSKRALKSNRKDIKDFWDYEYLDEKGTTEQIGHYFKKLMRYKENKDKTINVRESLLVRVNNIFDDEVEVIIKKIDELRETHYMPIVLFLSENSKHLKIDKKKYKRIDERLFYVINYTENKEEIDNHIFPYLLRFCSIHNELGDRFTIGEGNNAEDYDLIPIYFPFNINICCIGRFGQGKSTGVNYLLNEYKAKESAKGSAQTKCLTYYQVTDHPVRLLDIPGFEDEDTVKAAVQKFNMCSEKINKIKDNIHIICYFIKYGDDRIFQKLEYPILEEITKHKSVKIIYVITHSNPNMEDEDKIDFIDKINTGIQGITQGKDIFEEVQKIMTSTLDNTVFVNFHRDNKYGFEQFGVDDLFQKIYELFIQSDDYKSSYEQLDQEKINEKAMKLRAEAEDILLSNKVWGGIVGILPGIDWLFQKFVIKKNAAKKVGKIFGIDVKFIKEDQNPNKKNEIIKPEYITPGVETKCLDLEVSGDKLTEESTGYQVGSSFRVAGETGTYIGSGISIGTGLARAAAAITETTTTAAEIGTSTAVILGSTALKVVGAGLAVVGAGVGVGLGAYFTVKYCNQLLDQFVEYYKNNAKKIANSYIDAANYFKRK